jgi:geranylgeranylglycerol-phosphate geranylgeranyltransferase
MVVNDIYDIHLDKIDHPTRPLPSGIITLPEATGLVCILIGTIEYLSMNYLRADLHWIIHLSTTIMLTYTPILKRIPLIKNLACACMVTLSLFFTGLSVSTITITSQPHFPLLCMAMSSVFFGSVYNEILLDMRDVEGDRIHRIYTIPVLLGLPISYVLAFFLVYLNMEWNFLSMYYIFGVIKAMGYLLSYSPLLIQIHKVHENLYSKDSLSRASKESSIPLLLIMLYLCFLAVG